MAKGINNMIKKKSLQLVYSWCIGIIALLCACHSGPSHVGLKGYVRGLDKDTLLLFRQQLDSIKIDSFFCHKGHFEGNIEVDSFEVGHLLIRDDLYLPLYIHRNKELLVDGSLDSVSYVRVTGSEENDRLMNFHDSVRNFTDAQIQQAVQEYIKTNPKDIIGIEILRHYLMTQPQPDFSLIYSVIGNMGGNLRDDLYITDLSQYVKEATRLRINGYAPNFSAVDTTNTRYNRYTFNHKLILLHFWASWANQSEDVDMLHRITQKYKKNDNIQVVNISLDVDTLQWKEALKRDSIPGLALCDFKGWDGGAALNYQITRVPFTILINERARIELIQPDTALLKKQVEDGVKRVEIKYGVQNRKK